MMICVQVPEDGSLRGYSSSAVDETPLAWKLCAENSAPAQGSREVYDINFT